jgi:uncharacterized membrane protein
MHPVLVWIMSSLSSSDQPSDATRRLGENIDAILQAEEAAVAPRSRADLLTQAIGGFIGTLIFVLLQSVLVLVWIGLNGGLVPGVAPFDHFPFPLLSVLVSNEAVLLVAFVLMKQNREGVVADRRAHLDLQVNLLTEQETTKLIQMVERLSRHLRLNETELDSEARELGHDTTVENLVAELHRRLK